MTRKYKVKDLKRMLDDLVEGADEMELAFFVEVNGHILLRELHIPSMSTLVTDHEVGSTVEVWLTEKKGVITEVKPVERILAKDGQSLC